MSPCECTRLEASLDARSKLYQVSERERPQHEVTLGVSGDNVRCITALGDDAVHLVPGLQVLAEESDRHLRDRDARPPALIPRSGAADACALRPV